MRQEEAEQKRQAALPAEDRGGEWDTQAGWGLEDEPGAYEKMDPIAQDTEPNPPREDKNPAPFPKDKLGHTNYYQWRAKDYEDRTGKPAPAYYREYGDKYAHLFSEETYDKLSPEGKKWLENTRRGLQRKMEDGLASGEWDENDAEGFMAKAFDSHSEVYLEAGLDKLPANDLYTILGTPKLKDFNIVEGLETGVPVIVNKLQSIFT